MKSTFQSFKRITVHLTTEDHRQLKAIMKVSGDSQSGVVRKALDNLYMTTVIKKSKEK